MASTAQRTVKKKRQGIKRADKLSSSAAARKALRARLVRRAAQRDAAFAAVAHISAEDSREYRKKNAAPSDFWDQPTAE